MLRPSKAQQLEMLVDSISKCNLCDRMEGRCKVLSEKNGSLEGKVFFIGEAPGRLGADRTGVPFCGDQAGRNFELLLNAAGLTRQEVFVTNAVLCNPRNPAGNNSPPSKDEIRNCSVYLSMVLNLVSPEIVAPLGLTALTALNLISPHAITLGRDVRRPKRWMEYTLVPLYHPGARATMHRSLANQFGDFSSLGEIVGRPADRPKAMSQRQQLRLLPEFQPTLIHQLVYHFVLSLGTVSKFRLTKLLYLLDWQEVKTTSRLLTGSYYIFQKNGPLAVGLSQVLHEMEGFELAFQFRAGEPSYSPGTCPRQGIELSPELIAKTDSLLATCAKLNEAQIKTRAYLTDPMRRILQEQRKGVKMLNHPVFDGWLSGE